jgi:hypothetical protein
MPKKFKIIRAEHRERGNGQGLVLHIEIEEERPMISLGFAFLGGAKRIEKKRSKYVITVISKRFCMNNLFSLDTNRLCAWSTTRELKPVLIELAKRLNYAIPNIP